MWKRIVNEHGGRLPVRICAAAEGLIIPAGNVLMTIENTDPLLPALTNVLETLLMKVWYPTTVATQGYHVRLRLIEALRATGCALSFADYMLHDFGYRGVSSEESAALGGMAHLLTFNGTDTIAGLRAAREYYSASFGVAPGTAVSVAATEHSIMTSMGEPGERALLAHLIATHQNQTLSVVADSYDYYRFVDYAIAEYDLVKRCKVKLVIRPDSVTPQHASPWAVVVWTLNHLAETLGYTTNAAGYKTVPYGVLWGDGIGPDDIDRILHETASAGFAASNLFFGMGGGRLQKINRDTYRFAMKCSAMARDGVWYDIQKRPLDTSKRSKSGRLMLVRDRNDGTVRTIDVNMPTWDDRLLEPVFENGLILRHDTFNTIRARARRTYGGEAAAGADRSSLSAST